MAKRNAKKKRTHSRKTAKRLEAKRLMLLAKGHARHHRKTS